MDVAEVADRLEIADLLTRYARGLDERNWPTVHGVFAADAVLDYTAMDGPRGTREEALDWVASSLGAFTMSQHLISNVEIEFASPERNEAGVRCSLFNPMQSESGGSRHLFFVGGGYRNRVVRTPDGWRIAELVAYASWFHAP